METRISAKVLEDAKFIAKWEESKNVKDVAQSLGLTKANVQSKVLTFRNNGVELKDMPRANAVSMATERFSAGQKLLAEIRNISVEEVRELHLARKQERVIKAEERAAKKLSESAR